MTQGNYTVIRRQIERQVAVVTLDRPAKLNAMSNTLMRELRDALELPGNVRALVITGTGRAFSAGWDLSEADSVAEDDAVSWTELMNQLANLPLPTIAAIEGYCLGGGLVLALCCDLRVASTSARLGLPEILRGIFPGVTGSQRLVRLIGRARAKELMYFGQHIDAATAERWNLVNRVVPAGEALSEATRMADELARGAARALQTIKRLVDEGPDLPFAESVAFEEQLGAALADDPDAVEGIQAFLERREPRFAGVEAH